jgi:hypothetical protein
LGANEEKIGHFSAIPISDPMSAWGQKAPV